MAPPSLQESGSQLHLPENAVILPLTVHALMHASRLKKTESNPQCPGMEPVLILELDRWP